VRVALLVPVKALDQAKTRLSDSLGPSERSVLAWMLLKRVLREGAKVPDVQRRVVVTMYAPAMRLARRMGWEVLAEDEQTSESVSVDRASERLEAEGIDAVLRLPLDLPLVCSEDVRRLVRLGQAGMDAVLVPSRSGEGTNAVWRSPPTLFPSRFGEGSLRAHAGDARAVTAAMAIVPMERLGLDVDDSADLAELLRVTPNSSVGRYLRRISFQRDAAR